MDRLGRRSAWQGARAPPAKPAGTTWTQRAMCSQVNPSPPRYKEKRAQLHDSLAAALLVGRPMHGCVECDVRVVVSSVGYTVMFYGRCEHVSLPLLLLCGCVCGCGGIGRLSG